MKFQFQKFTRNIAITIGAALIVASCAINSATPKNPMGFFLTSVNPGKGADLGGLEGADKYCEALASSVGAGGKAWKAYLSAAASGSSAAINAKDRIGNGPWQNAKGIIIANNVAELHGTNNLNKQTALTEKGDVISGRGDPVNQHDILTGSTDDGRLAIAAAGTAIGSDTTCGNWSKSGDGSAFVGHHDRIGANDSAPMKSWNSSHPSRGCGMDALKATGGSGLFYCFATTKN